MRKSTIALLSALALAIAIVLSYREFNGNQRELEDAIVEFKNGEFTTAVPQLVRLADQGDLAAARFAAIAYIRGHGVKPDLEKAERYVRMLDKSEQRSVCTGYLDGMADQHESVSGFWAECVE